MTTTSQHFTPVPQPLHPNSIEFVLQRFNIKSSMKKIKPKEEVRAEEDV